MQSTALPSASKDQDPSRFLASRIDGYARSNPDRCFVSIPRSTSPKEGFQDVTYGEFAKSINKAAWWLDREFGDAQKMETFTYFGPRDLRYLTLVVAGIKTGRMLQLVYPYLSTKGTVQILDAVKCQTILYAGTAEAETRCEELQAECPSIGSFPVPEMEDWFGGDSVATYVYDKTWEGAIDERVVGFHTSGTTGSPKAVVYYNSTLVSLDAQYKLGQLGPPLLVNSWVRRRILNNFAMYHQMWSMKPSVTETCLGAVITPSVLEDMARQPATLHTLQNLHTLQFGSAPLNRTTADVLSTHTESFQSVYGSTELSFPPFYQLVEREDWEYTQFHPFAGCTFEPRDNGLFELVVIRKEEFAKFQAIFTTCPQLSQFNTKDLWSPHPTRVNLWKYEGRTDDLLVLSNGLHIHTSRMEWTVQEHPLVRSALVGGYGRPRPFLLVELADNTDEVASLSSTSQDTEVGRIWLSVEKANELVQSEKAILLSKPFTIIVAQDKPLARTLKGTLDRQKCLALYHDDVDRLFHGADDGAYGSF